MASSSRSASTGSTLRPRSGQPSHAEDLYSWVERHVALLRAGQMSEIDAETIAEELSDVGSEQLDKLESAIRVTQIHMLKWDHQPRRRSRSRALSIAVPRVQIEKVLRRNPGLTSRLEEAWTVAYKQARPEAAKETRLILDRFPVARSHIWDEIIGRSFSVDGEAIA
jgi:Domain of unknown function DUF29